MKRKLKINRFIIIAILIYFVYTIFSQQQTLNSYEKEAQTYNEQIEEAKEETEELTSIKENMNSTEYIENVAREKLSMYLPNERVYIDVSE